MGGGEAGAGKALPAPLVDLAAFALRLDEAFGRWPWGRGLVLIARRSG
jgi:hypothetical protein